MSVVDFRHVPVPAAAAVVDVHAAVPQLRVADATPFVGVAAFASCGRLAAALSWLVVIQKAQNFRML